MKSLSLDRPLIIVMLGVPGSGKSYFARQFSDMFSAPMVSFDRLRFELFAEPLFSKDEETIIERVAITQIEELVKTKKTFMIDGGMNVRTSRAEVEKIAKQAGYGTLVIWVQTDEQTAQARSMRRNPSRLYDEYNVSLSPEMHEKLARRMTPPSVREPLVVISGKHTYATQAKMILKKLVSPRETQIADATTQLIKPDPRPLPPPKRRNVTIN